MGHSQDGNYGENVYYNTMNPQDSNFHMKNAVQSWFDEHKQFRYPNSCGGACGHYTQVVWAKSKKVGCGFTVCDGIAGWVGSKAVMLVCNYDPPGNFNNEPPYRT
uniref:SCP domain-containing protein n=1 Tax=Romanomermis culicivorax TaxID=13658 RepID=A0A915K960_ROMCU